VYADRFGRQRRQQHRNQRDRNDAAIRLTIVPPPEEPDHERPHNREQARNKGDREHRRQQSTATAGSARCQRRARAGTMR
jgi:hypothetical protein